MSVLRITDFRVIWSVGSVGEFARRMELLVLSWLTLQVTDSYFQLGLVLVFNNAPRPVIAMFTGYIADRFSRQKIMLYAQLANVLTTATLLGVIAYDRELIQAWHVFGAVLIQGLTKAIEDPSRRTAILDIVGERRLVNALSLDVISHNVGRMLGPIAGGVLLDTVNFTGAYSALVAVHLFNLALITRLRIPAYQGRPLAEPMFRSLGTALRYAWKSPVLVSLLYMTMVMNALAFPVQQFIPAIGRDHLGVGVTMIGLLAAADGFGHLAGAAVLSLSRDMHYHGRIFAFGSLLVLAMVALFVWAPWYWLAFGLLALSGIGQSGFSTMQGAITMLAAPPDMRGRMMGLLSACIGLSTPLGALEIGAVAAAFALQPAISLNAAAGIVLLIPAIALTSLAWKPLTPPAPAPVSPSSP